MPALNSVSAFTDDALGGLDTVGLVEALQAGTVSQAEVIEAAIARIEYVNPKLNAVVVTDFDRAREARPQAGYFAGIPTIIKDNCDVAGLPTQQGSASYRARPARKDGDLVHTFLASGMVNLGKSQLSEFGFSASAEFVDREPVRNPWSTAHSTGASSAGSAALVASGALSIAHANDGGGSIRIPAAVCGLVGLKPSRGRVFGDAATRSLPVKIITDGALARSVRDIAAFFREYEKSYAAPGLPAIGEVSVPNSKRLRIGMVLDSPVGPSDPEVVAATRETGALLESLGHHVEEVEAPVPPTFTEDFLLYWALLSALELGAGKLLLDRSFKASRTDNLSRGLAKHALANIAHIPGAVKRLRGAQQYSVDFYRSWDLTLNPTLAAPTPELGWLNPGQPYEILAENLLSWVRFTPLQNASGDPAISLPLDDRWSRTAAGNAVRCPDGRGASTARNRLGVGTGPSLCSAVLGEHGFSGFGPRHFDEGVPSLDFIPSPASVYPSRRLAGSRLKSHAPLAQWQSAVLVRLRSSDQSR